MPSTNNKIRKIKEVSSEEEANTYIRLGWTLIKTLRNKDNASKNPVTYVFAWKTFRRINTPRKTDENK
jgi:hypothetical protein